MGDIFKAIDEDIEEYIWLCKRFKERVTYKKDAFGNFTPDPYGDHAKRLRSQVKR